MHYNGYGQMDTITDAASMTSSFTYDPYTGYMTQMQTPYGYTTFAHTDLGNMENGIDVGNAGGTNRVSRACLVTLPDNSHELYAFRFDSSTVGIPDNYSAQAPSGTPLGTLDTGGTSDPNNSPSYLRNSFYWDRKQAALLSSLTPANLVAADYLVANRSHWLVAADGTTNHLSESISTYQEASPDGSNPGHIMWYDYAGKGGTSPWLEGGISQQSGVVAQMLPDGTTQYSYTQYNPLGLPCIETSTYTLANGSVGTRQISKDYTNAVYSEWIVHTTQGYNIGYNYWTNNTLLSVLGPENDILLTIGTLTNKAVITTQVDGYGDTWTTTNMYPIYAQQVFTDVSNNVTRLFYNTRGQISGSKLPTGLTHTNLYAANGFIQKSIDSEIARTNTYAFTNGLLASHTNELGLVTTLTWDALQRLTSIKYPDATTISNVYTYLDLTNQKDRMGNWAHAIYDNMRQMTNCTDRLGHTTTLTYCNCGSLDSVTDPLLNTTSYVRDNNGRLLSEDFGGVPFRQYTLDSIGRVSTVTETSGASVTYSYNNQGNVVQATGQYGTLFQTRYNIENDPDVVINADGTAVTNTYDRLHRVITSSTTNGVSRNNYTGVLLASAVDALNRTNWFTYDAAGHVTWTTNANSEKQNYTYNAAGNTISFTDAKTQKTSWGYDVYGRAITETNAANVVVRTNGYDANNRLTACWSKARGQTVISFDACDNATNIAYPTLSPVKLTYDALNRPATMSNEVGVTTFGYVPFGAFKGVLNSEAGPFSTVSYGYVNNLLSTLTASSWSQSFTYDLQNRLQGITSPAGSFNLGYNGPSQEIAAIAGPGHTSAQTFDAVGNIKSTTLKDQFNNILDSYSYDYDSVGNRTNATRVDGSYVHYNYDKIGQLYKSVGFEQNGTPRLNEAFMYSYDKAGNLNSRSNFTLVLAFNVNNLNALTNVTRVRTPMYLGDPNGYTLIAAGHLSAPANSVTVNGQTADLYKDQTFAAIVPIVDGANSFTNTAVDKLGRPSTVIITRTLPLSISFTNDDNGNLLSDGVRSFVYDDANRLREVYVTNSWRSVYICDGLSRRSKRMDYNWQASAWNITNETHYVYAGPQVIQELNASNIPVVSYTIGAGLLARTDANGSLYYHVDGNNNVTMLVNGQGTVMASYTYDPYGNIISRSGPMADANLYRFASQEIDPTAGIYAYLFRFHDPNLQRWLTKDPIGLRGGRNVFAFVGNNPISRIDPLGLEGNPISSTLPGLSGSWNSNPTGPGGMFYGPGYLWIPPQPLLPPYPYPTYPQPAGADYWDTKWGGWAESGLQSDPVMDVALFGIGPAMRGSALRVCPATVPVSRWGRLGLQPGDWVMNEPKNPWNYLRSGKWQPGWGNEFAPYGSGMQYEVPPSALQWSSGWGLDGRWKGLFGQRIYNP